tara:strand:+ start:2303 stop:4279 length:1977 start_codon:yes stop_codon:yes gene_type:complete
MFGRNRPVVFKNPSKNVQLAEAGTKRDDDTFFSDYQAKKEYLIDDGNFLSPGQIARETLTLGAASGIVQQEIRDRQKKARRRARTLTYMEEVLGITPAPRMQMMGMGGGGGKLPSSVPVPPGFVVPEWYSLIPNAAFDTSGQVSKLTPAEKITFVKTGEYANYLNNGGENLDDLDAIANYLNPVNDSTESPPSNDSTESKIPPSNESTELKTPTKDAQIGNKNNYSLFRAITAGKYTQKEQSDLYKSGGGKKFISDYINKNGKPKNQKDLDNLRDSFEQNPKITADDFSAPEGSSSSSSMNDETVPGERPADDAVDDTLTPENKDLRNALMGVWLESGYTQTQALYLTNSYLTRYSGSPSPPNPYDLLPGIASPDLLNTKTGVQNPFPDGGGDPSGEVPKKPVDEDMAADSPPSDDPPDGVEIETIKPRTPKEIKEDKKKKKRKPIPLPRGPGDPDPDPPETDSDSDSDSDDDDDEVENEKKNPSNVGHLRPSFLVGGQDILLLTEAEKLEEIRDYNLFDLPIPVNEEPDNPLHLNYRKQQAFRYFGRVAEGNFVRTPRIEEEDPYSRQMYGTMGRKYRKSGFSNSFLRETINNIGPVGNPLMAKVDRRLADPFDRTPYNYLTTNYARFDGRDEVVEINTLPLRNKQFSQSMLSLSIK